MNKILDYLNDPAWWFSVVFIGIVASLIASFFFRQLEKLLPYVSRRARWRRRFKQRRTVRRARAIAADNMLLMQLLTSNVQANILGATFSALFFVIIIVEGMWLVLLAHIIRPDTLPSPGIPVRGILFIVVNLLGIIFALVGLINQERANRRKEILNRIQWRYLRKKKLPMYFLDVL